MFPTMLILFILHVILIAVIILITELPNLIGYIRRKAEKRKN